jgi:hypothetical protein
MRKIFLWSLTILVFASGCNDMMGRRVRGNGHITTENRTVDQFNSIDVSGSIEVYVKQDSVRSVKIEGDENILQYIEIHTEGETLSIHTRNGIRLQTTRKIKVYVSNASYKDFEASGACNIYTENKITSSGKLSIDLSGASKVKMDLKAPEIYAGSSGSGHIELSGETKNLKVDGTGSTDIRTFNLLAENTDVEITGSGNAEVFASVKLDVHVSGAGSVKYKGNASVSQDISGAGSVKKVD